MRPIHRQADSRPPSRLQAGKQTPDRQADSRQPIENIMRRSPYVKQCLMRVRKPTPHGSTGSRVNNIGSIILVPSLLTPR